MQQYFFTIRSFANKAVNQIGKAGIYTNFIRLAKEICLHCQGVMSFVDVGGPIRPGELKDLNLKVIFEHLLLTVIGMIVQSPDCFVQINYR